MKNLNSKNTTTVGGCLYFCLKVIVILVCLNFILKFFLEMKNKEMIGGLVILIVGILAFLLYRKKVKELEKNKNKVLEKFKDVDDGATKIALLEKELQNLLEEKKKIYAEVEKLKSEVNLLNDENNLLSFGFYEFKYDYEKSQEYNDKLQIIKNNQKMAIKNKEAAVCYEQWSVDGSLKEGKKIAENILKLALRAFNGESDAAIAKAKYNNVHIMESRIEKSYEAINKMISYFKCRIDDKYKDLKIDELHLNYEYCKKLEEEKEEQRRIREEMREELKVQKEIEKAQLEAQKEEERTKKALQLAEEKLKSAHGEEILKFQQQIEKLKVELEEARKNKERAIAQAQLTKSGHVYVISNIGSFGENVYKIGMTRRLEPMDRVKELGDASVPFDFDVHALIYSENAPELEKILHKEFYDNRVNKVNDKREFFRVELEKIKEVALKYKADIKFTMIAEAEQYRQTLAMEREKIK